MELKSLPGKASKLLQKYKYAALVVAIGIILMSIPSFQTKEIDKQSTPTPETITEVSFEQRLEEVLCSIEGAGRVQVMLTVAVGEEVVYQTDDDNTTGGNTSTTRFKTVTVTDAQRNQNGLVRQINPPLYKGAVIICQGGDNPSVRLQIVDAVSKLTGLGANHISVLKMK